MLQNNLVNTDHRERRSLTRSNILLFEKILLLTWFVLNLVIGALTVHEYGISIDEPNNYRYADNTLKAYPSFFGMFYEPTYSVTYNGHGPAFVAIAGGLIKIVQRVFPNVFAPDLWHFSYFVTFQLTALCLYWLTKRWFSTWAAWGILILFGTQPLLLGHSFVNPKDIPFMFLLTLSIVSGFRLVDSIETKEAFISLEGTVKLLTSKFQAADRGRKKKFITYLALALAAVLALIVFSRQIDSLVVQIVTFFYTASPGSWAGRIFSSVASRASDLSTENYIVKALRLLERIRTATLFAGLLFFLAYFGLVIGNTTLPDFLGAMWKQRHKLREAAAGLAKSLRNSLHLAQLKIWSIEILRAMWNPHVLLAGIALGLATGVRAIAPWAGVIVVLYLLTKVRSGVWTTTIAYFLIAGIVTYLVWPRLWGAPFQRYLEGLGFIVDFPGYPQRVLFNGNLYNDTSLPRSYLPVLLNIQFNEPFLLSFYLGFGALIWRLLRDRLRADLLIYVGLGFALPLLGLLLLSPPLYNNFRQALFLIPAMFVPAAFAFELVFNKLRQRWVRVLLIAAIALPGLYSSIKLYPYEYAYYNSLVGGTAGASNYYDLDYFRISLREAAIQLNEIAPPGATVVVTRSAGLFVEYARPDLIVDKPINSTLDLSSGYDYLVQVFRVDGWEQYPEVENLIAVERGGALFATVKAVKNVTTK